MQLEIHSEKIGSEIETVEQQQRIIGKQEETVEQSQETVEQSKETTEQPQEIVMEPQETIVSSPPSVTSSLLETCELRTEELKALTELLPEDSWDESVHSSGGESNHSWKVAGQTGETLSISDKNGGDVDSGCESHLIIRHNIIFSDSDGLSVPSSPERKVCGPEALTPVTSLEVTSPEPANQPEPGSRLELVIQPELENQSESVNQLEPMIQLESVRQLEQESQSEIMNQPKQVTQREALNEPTVLIEPVESPPSVSIPPESMITPPRPTHKRSMAEVNKVRNESPFCSPSKILTTAVPALPVIETPTRPQRNPKEGLGVEQSPTKVLEEQREESLYHPFIPYLSSDFISLKETGHPLSTQMHRLLVQQEEERNRFQQLMRSQTNGLCESFQREREEGKVVMIIQDHI